MGHRPRHRLLTGFYMSRQVFLVFFGKARWNEADATTGEAEQSAAGVTDGGGETSTHAEDEQPAPVAQASRRPQRGDDTISRSIRTNRRGR